MVYSNDDYSITEQQAWKQCDEDRRLNALRKVKTPLGARWFAVLLIGFMLLTAVALAFIPWQQTVNGIGEITVLSPMNRPQELRSSLTARIKRWLVREGEMVKTGQIILELEEIQTSYLDEALLERMRKQREAYNAKQDALLAEIAAANSEMGALESGRDFAVPSAQRKQGELLQKLRADQRKVSGSEQKYETAKLNLDRVKTLWQEGLRSRRDYELAQQSEAESLAELQAAEAQVAATQQAIAGAGFDVGKTDTDFSAKLASLTGKIAKSQQEIATLASEMQDLDIKIANLEARKDQRQVKAPIAGRVVQAQAVGPGVTVKEGDPLATILPESDDRVAALYVNDFNAPLLKPGQQVRLQFSGWPALQFTGFPQAAMGTFAGEIKLIDAVSDASNQFRILVVPDKERIAEGEQRWPDPRLLRPGTQVSGWVMLDMVPLGYELWRRFNGFPPSLRDSTKPMKQKPEGIKSAAVKGGK